MTLRQKTMAFRTPESVGVFLTTRCEGNCPQCLLRGRKGWDRELDAQGWERVARTLGAVQHLALTGGEPSLREDLVELGLTFCEHCRPSVLEICTEGTRLERVEALIRALASRFPSTWVEIQFSLDGPAVVHDRLRGREGLFDSVLRRARSVKALRKIHPRLRLKGNVLWQEEGQGELLGEWLSSFVETSPFDRMQLSYPQGEAALDPLPPMPETFFSLSQRLSSSPPRRLLDFWGWLSRGAKLARDDVYRKGLSGGNCGAGVDSLVLSPSGEVLPCEPAREAVGTLAEEGASLEGIFNGSSWKDFQRRRLHRGGCACTWGCAAAAAGRRGWAGRLRVLIRSLQAFVESFSKAS